MLFASAALFAALYAGPPPRPRAVPILMYHRIAQVRPGATGTEPHLTTSPALFRTHLAFLRASGYRTVTFRDLKAWREGRRTLPPRPVILSFDDGTADHRAAALELRRHGMAGVFFVITDRIGRSGYLDAADVVELARAGMEVGSHSAAHPDLRVLSGDACARELRDSRGVLQRLTGVPVVSFAYPGGGHDAGVVAAVAAAGYTFARTTEPGVALVDSRGRFELPAIPMSARTDARALARRLRRHGHAPRRAAQN